MMYGCSSGKGSVVVHVHVATEQRGIGHHDPTADTTVVCDMGTGHEIAVTADGRETLFFFRGAIDGDSFAKDIVVTDLDAGVTTLPAEVLGSRPDYHARKELVVFSYGDPFGERNVVY